MEGLNSIALAAAHLNKMEETPLMCPPQIPQRCISTESKPTSPPPSPSEVFNRGEPSDRGDPVPEPPTHLIKDMNENDVLCGRGGETNHHSGNVQYRQLVRQNQLAYLRARRRDKPSISRLIVEAVRRKGGRFLKKVEGSDGCWRDVGDKKAREKTSQALREKAPDLRKDDECHSTAATTPSIEQEESHGTSPKPQEYFQNYEGLSSITGAMLPAMVSPYPLSQDGFAWAHQHQHLKPPPPLLSLTNSIKKRKLNHSGNFQINSTFPSVGKEETSAVVSPAPSFYVSDSSPSVNDDNTDESPPPPPEYEVTNNPKESTKDFQREQTEPRSNSVPKPIIRGPRLRILKARMDNPSFLSLPRV